MILICVFKMFFYFIYFVLFYVVRCLEFRKVETQLLNILNRVDNSDLD